MMFIMEDKNILKWRFDVSTFRLIGRELITDRITALFELVKNSYDANANTVSVIFENVKKGGSSSQIRIVDDGCGMTFEDVRDKWMVIGTANKRKCPYTDAPYNRKCVGKKGIGRFAVDKLGDILEIQTKVKGSTSALKVNINWAYYEKAEEKVEEIKLFTDIENEYSIESVKDIEAHGTTLKISGLREEWKSSDIRRFINEVAGIVSPFANFKFPFSVKVIAEEFGISELATKDKSDLKLATTNFTLKYDQEKGTQDYAEFNDELGRIEVKSGPLEIFGGVRLSLFYFDAKARKKYNALYKNDKIDGVKIYRDGIITTPFAENEEDQDKQRDILGIDKRLWQDIFNRVSTREVIGIVEITAKDNPSIIDATNRQDFVDNQEYRALKNFIIQQLDAIQQYKIYMRKKEKEDVEKGLGKARVELNGIADSLTRVAKNNPGLKPHLDPIIQQAGKTEASIKRAMEEQKKAEEENVRKENIYMSIMSLQEYAIHITHAVRTSLNKIKYNAEFFVEYYPNTEFEEDFKRYAKEIYSEIIKLNNVIDYMLSYSQSNMQVKEIDLDETISEIFRGYDSLLAKENIDAIVDMSNNLRITTNRQFLRDIFENLINNSIKALAQSDKKIIKCSVYTDENKLQILFSDTGVGIPISLRKWVFGLYNTTTEDQGGAGVGLYIVKMRVESMKGHVTIIDSEFGDYGTTFKIELPFCK